METLLEETYLIEGYSTIAPLARQRYSVWWGGLKDVESAEHLAQRYKTSTNKVRVVRVTRELVKEL